MLDTIKTQRNETFDRVALGNHLHHALAQIALLTPSLHLLQIALEDNNRTVTVLLGSIYNSACYMLNHSIMLTQNQICDNALQHIKRVSEMNGDFPVGVDIVRTLTLPVWSRLIRDGHSSRNAALQSLLHILAWRSDSRWLQDQAQRLLWQGGILGVDGEQALSALDNEAFSRDLTFPAAGEILATTCFLSVFPTGSFA
ncbi:hypothetical protein S969_001636 [Salmonella enterica subsp. salamae serovar 6,7:z:1,5]|nr:hypothetical protein [Salmonella enterica subsp. salamae serovar 6,7:z:1,5]HCH7729723.1 hypothetical protein [Salmonella enterica subsp. enterica serovar Infantis]HCH7829756.1 hypothetical protein [Salmonella enterica subsp. enterica serovar Infantis]HCH7833133.1 hypothetical protein [Salmonella enterica subsp. enterica serovar Infantis]HCI4928243.1 hypothetical protein [Salmonella enterica subsp. enterica serovar Infantis]